MPMVSFILHSVSVTGTICIHRLKGSGEVVVYKLDTLARLLLHNLQRNLSHGCHLYRHALRVKTQVLHFVFRQTVFHLLQITQVGKFFRKQLLMVKPVQLSLHSQISS